MCSFKVCLTSLSNIDLVFAYLWWLHPDEAFWKTDLKDRDHFSLEIHSFCTIIASLALDLVWFYFRCLLQLFQIRVSTRFLNLAHVFPESFSMFNQICRDRLALTCFMIEVFLCGQVLGTYIWDHLCIFDTSM